LGGRPHDPSPARSVVEAFYHALSIRDMPALANFLDDNVVWTISGPDDILPFCGQRVGQDLVMKLLGRDSPTLLSGRRFVAKTMLVDGDRAAVLGRLTATKRASGQAISYRIAHFIQFRDEGRRLRVDHRQLRRRRTIAGLQPRCVLTAIGSKAP
jgi:ketosteroid isomerase-like protein